MAGDLRSYVQGLQKRGYSRQQIEGFLLSENYSPAEIKQAFEKKSLFSFLRKEPDKKIVGYIENSLAMGYSRSSVEEVLKQYYSQRDIKRAMDSVEHGEVRHIIDLSNKAFLIAIALILMVGCAGIFLLMSMDSPKQLLDFKIDIDNTELLAGETLHFTNSFINMGADRKYDIVLEYKVTNMKTGEVLESKGETIGVSTTIENRRSITLPKDALPGKYRLEGIARYGKDLATSYANFQVVKPGPKATCDDGIRNQQETDVDCGGPCDACASCRDGMRNQNEEDIDCGGVCPACTRESCSDNILNQNEAGVDCGGICSPCDSGISVSPDNEEILKKVTDLGAINEAESVRLCNEIDSEMIKDDCFIVVSQAFNHSKYCEYMVSKRKSNICYSNFVQMRDYSVCEKIDDVWIRKSCQSLRQIEDVLKQQNITMPSAPG